MGGLASEIKASGPKTQKAYHNLLNKQKPDGTWPEPTTEVTDYLYYQTARGQIGENPTSYEMDYNEGTGKIQKLMSINPDGTETLVFSLNQHSAADVSHQAAHYLIPNLLAEMGITNTLLYADEILVVAFQDGLKVCLEKNNITIDVFVKNNFRLNTFEKLGLTEAEHKSQVELLYKIYFYITTKLTPKILQNDPQIVAPMEAETVRYKEYRRHLRELQEPELVKANLLEKVKRAGTWEIPYGPLEGFEEFEFGEIPPLTSDYSVEVAKVNMLIGEIDGRIKFKNLPKTKKSE